MSISQAQVKVWVLCTPKAALMSCISDHPRLPTSNKLCFCFHWDSVLLWRLISKPLILLPPPLLSADTRYLPSQPVPWRHPSPVLMGRILLGGKGRVGEINSPGASLPGYASEHSACQRSQIHVEGSHTCTQIKAIFFKTSEDEIKFQTLNHLSNLWIWHICIAWAYRQHPSCLFTASIPSLLGRKQVMHLFPLQRQPVCLTSLAFLVLSASIRSLCS